MVSLCVTYFSKIWRDTSMQFIHIKQRNKYHNAILSSLSLENIHSIIQLHQVTFYPSICSWKLTKSCYTIGTPLAWIESKTLERSLQVGFHNGSVLNWCQAIILANDDPVLWCNMPHQASITCEQKIVGDLGPRICIFFIENYHILLKFVPKGSIHNKSALVQVMAWWRIGNKLLPETMLTKTYDAIWHHTASLGLKQVFMHQERKYIHDIINDDLQRIFCTEVDTLIKETSKFTDTKSCMSVWLDFPYTVKPLV